MTRFFFLLSVLSKLGDDPSPWPVPILHFLSVLAGNGVRLCVRVLCVGVRVWIGGGASAWERIVEFRQEMGVNIKEWEISSPPPRAWIGSTRSGES